MGRMLLVVVVVPGLLLGCATSNQRPEVFRAESRESRMVAVPAPRTSRPTPRPESHEATLSAPAERATPAANASRARSAVPLTQAPAPGPGQGSERREAAAEKQVFEGISGLVIDETMTKIGREFFDQFCLLWEPPATGLSGYNVIISERASPLWGTWITVSIDDVAIWSKVLKPRSEELEPEVEEARATVYEYVSNYEQYQMQTEDMAGTGF